jgi:hypothetical protein
MTSPRTVRRHDDAWLAGLALAAAGLAVASRLHHSLSVDEPFVANSLRLPWAALIEVFKADNIPLVYVLLKGWTAVFGEAEWALRSLFVVAYSAAVIMTGLAGRRVSASATGLMAATLVATSTKVGLWHAATARPYALLALIASIALWQSLTMTTRGNAFAGRRAAALAATHLLGLFTHPTYVFVIAAYASASAVVRRTVVNAATLAAVVAVAVYAVSWGAIFRATFVMHATSWMTPPGVGDLKAAFLLLWGTGPGMMLAGAVMVLALGDLARTRRAATPAGVRWVAVAAGLAWVLPVAVSFWRPVFLPARTPVMLLPVTAVLLGSLLEALAGRLALVTLGGVLLLAASQALPSAARREDPVPTRASVQAVLKGAVCGDTLLATGLAADPVEYYMRRLDAPSCVHYAKFPTDMRNWTGRVGQPSAMEPVRLECRRLVDALAAREGRVWVFGATRGMGAEALAMFTDEARRALSCEPALARRGAGFDTVFACQARR